VKPSCGDVGDSDYVSPQCGDRDGQGGRHNEGKLLRKVRYVDGLRRVTRLGKERATWKMSNGVNRKKV